MRFTALLPYVTALLVGRAVLDATAGIVAVREGGMGLGSALIVATVVHVAGLGIGAVLAGPLVDRRSPGLAMVIGAVVLYAGLLAIGTAPMGALGWLMGAFGLAGLGFGFVLTAAFAAAAGLAGPARPIGIVFLLGALLVSRALIGVLGLAGPPALVAVGATVVVLGIVAAWSEGATALRGPARHHPPIGSLLLGAGLIGIGAMAAIAGADPSGLSATVLASSIGADRLGALDAIRVAMAAIGLVFLVAGGGLMLAGTMAPGFVRSAVAALALVTIAATGLTSALQVSATVRDPMGSAGPIAAIATTIGGLMGLTLAGWWLLRAGTRWVVALAGCAAVAVVSLVALAMLAGRTPPIGGALLPIAIGALGLALAAAALRVVLAEVPAEIRGVAAGAGVAAAGIGSSLGSMVGVGAAMSSLSGAGGLGVAGALTVASAVAVVVVLVWRPEHDPTR